MIYETKYFKSITGEFIVREGEIGKGFYILEKGEFFRRLFEGIKYLMKSTLKVRCLAS